MSAAEEVGPRLRAERERRGISVQKAADELRLDGRAVEALELGQFERIGPGVYAKGHLKRYAAFLGLPLEEIAAGCASLDVHQAESALLPAATQMRPRPPFSLAHALPWRRFAMPALLMLSIAGVLWWKPWRAAPARPPAAPPTAQAPNRAVAAGRAPVRAEAQVSPTAAGAESAGAVAPRAGSVHLRLVFSANSWVDVHDGAGKRLFDGLKGANTSLALVGRAPLALVIGFAGGVRTEINGHPVQIEPALVSGHVARFSVGADGALGRPPYRSRPQN